MYNTVTTLSSRLEVDECRQALLVGRPRGSDTPAPAHRIETSTVSHSSDLRMRLAEPGLWIVPLATQHAMFAKGASETVITTRTELSGLLMIVPAIPGLLALTSLVAALSGGGPLAIAFTVLLISLSGIAAFHLHTQARRDADVLLRQTVALLEGIIVPSSIKGPRSTQRKSTTASEKVSLQSTVVLPEITTVITKKQPPTPSETAPEKSEQTSTIPDSPDKQASPQWKVFRPIRTAQVSKVIPTGRPRRNRQTASESKATSGRKNSALQIETPRKLAGGMPARAVVLSTVDESRLGSMTTTLLDLRISRPDGENYQIKTLVLFMTAQERDQIQEGIEIPVHYDPADPTKVVLDPIISPN